MADMRLIDANALKKHLRNLVASGGHKYYRKGMDDTLHRHMPNIIDDQPTVEAAPVVHGRWIDTSPNYRNGYYNNAHKCSNCGDYYTTDPNDLYYCPRCGAKMDLEVPDGKT